MAIQNGIKSEVRSGLELKAGTGFMMTLTEGLKAFESQGYTENIVAKKDHFLAAGKQKKILPSEIHVDEIVRFENTSDPADQSILYAISVPGQNLKGLLVESYGIYNEDFTEEMMQALKTDSEPSSIQSS